MMISYFEKIARRLEDAAEQVNRAAWKADLQENCRSCGKMETWASLLEDMGHSVSVPQHQDGIYTVIEQIIINGHVIADYGTHSAAEGGWI